MKHLPLLFASRLLRSAKSLSVINTTATVSSVATGVAVAAMVILMSVYNGFDSMLKGIYDTTEADLVITPAKGKTFEVDAVDYDALRGAEGVENLSTYIEESVVVEYRGRQTFATLRGVDSAYVKVVGLDNQAMLWYGKWQLTHGSYRRAVVGRDVDNLFADGYSAKNATLHDALTVHALRKGDISPLVPMSALRSAKIRHAGTLSESATSLTGHIFTSLDWAQELLSGEGRVSHIALSVVEGGSITRTQKAVQSVVGEGFVVKNRYELNEAVYKATKLEKWGVFFVLLLVTIIAAATIVGSLVMLITEKQNDIATLYSIGARRSFVKRVFTLSGLLIGGRGVAGGILAGVAICAVQIIFGVIKMPGSTFLLENYPVKLAVGDIVGIIVAVMTVTWIITNFTISRMLPRANKPDEARIQ